MSERSLDDVIRNLLQDSDLSFRDFMEIALYYPEFGYYARRRSPVGREGDFVTSPAISPVFGYALGRLVHEFLRRDTDGLCSIVDIGSGDGSLINILYAADVRARFFGVDRAAAPIDGSPVAFLTDLARVPALDHQVVICNELFDAIPFARLVMRGDELHELWVTERDGHLDWSEHEAAAPYGDYFAERGIELKDGQFADVSLDWQTTYDDICRFVTSGLIVTFDYGMPGAKLFDARTRRFGTAAAYAQHRVSRDLLANPGDQDLTAHINFSDLQTAGERNGFQTLFFDSQAKFLLALGAQSHELLQPNERVDSLELRAQREDARRLVLPDGIGEEIRVLVQTRGMSGAEWSFQRPLW